jgi:hypothetical protein
MSLSGKPGSINMRGMVIDMNDEQLLIRPSNMFKRHSCVNIFVGLINSTAPDQADGTSAGRPSKQGFRATVNGMLYVVKTDCQW